MQLPIIG